MQPKPYIWQVFHLFLPMERQKILINFYTVCKIYNSDFYFLVKLAGNSSFQKALYLTWKINSGGKCGVRHSQVFERKYRYSTGSGQWCKLRHCSSFRASMQWCGVQSPFGSGAECQRGIKKYFYKFGFFNFMFLHCVFFITMSFVAINKFELFCHFY